jgi:hypothetical protein
VKGQTGVKGKGKRETKKRAFTFPLYPFPFSQFVFILHPSAFILCLTGPASAKSARQ